MVKIFFSTALIILAYTLPLMAYYLYKKRPHTFGALFVISPIFTIGILALGISSFMKPIGNLLFYACMVEVTLIIMIVIVVLCKQGLLAFSKEEKRTKRYKTKVHLIVSAIVSILGIIIMYNIDFGFLYAFWGLMFSSDDKENLMRFGDYIFYAFQVNFSLSQSGVFSEFQHLVNSNAILRYIQVAHVLIAKLIELVFISFASARILEYIMSTLSRSESATSKKKNGRQT